MLQITATDEDIYSLNGNSSQEACTPQSSLCAIISFVNFLFFYSLASIHFQFYFVYKSLFYHVLPSNVQPCNGLEFMPASHNYMLFCGLVTSLSTVHQGSLFLQFCDKIQQSNLACTKYSLTYTQQFPQDHHTWRVPPDFHKVFPLKRGFPAFLYRTCFFCCLPIFSSLEPSKPLKSKLISTPPQKGSRTTGLEL